MKPDASEVPLDLEAIRERVVNGGAHAEHAYEDRVLLLAEVERLRAGIPGSSRGTEEAEVVEALRAIIADHDERMTMGYGPNQAQPNRVKVMEAGREALRHFGATVGQTGGSENG